MALFESFSIYPRHRQYTRTGFLKIITNSLREGSTIVSNKWTCSTKGQPCEYADALMHPEKWFIFFHTVSLRALHLAREYARHLLYICMHACTFRCNDVAQNCLYTVSLPRWRFYDDVHCIYVSLSRIYLQDVKPLSSLFVMKILGKIVFMLKSTYIVFLYDEESALHFYGDYRNIWRWWYH